MEIVLDVQGFKRSLNKFVFKEVAVITLEDDSIPLVFNFQSPYLWKYLLSEYKNVNRWLEKYWHGIPWNSGDIPYERLSDTLKECCKDATRIWVKGEEKRKWVAEILHDKLICNIEHSGCPSFSTLAKNDETPTCSLHQCSNPSCAFKNVQMLKNWLLGSGKGADEVDANCRFTSFNSLIVSEEEEEYPCNKNYCMINKDLLHSMYA